MTEATHWYRTKKEEKRNSDKIEKESSCNFERLCDEKEQWKEKTQSWKGWRKLKRKYRTKEKWPEKEKENVVEKIQSVIFIQHTPRSELAKRVRKRLRELESVGRIKIKIVERTGDMLSDVLCKSDS